jgi:membrane fusion protein, multidrug efflux system
MNDRNNMADKLKHPFVLLAAAFLVAGGAYWVWHRSHRYESTDNAYVNARVVHVAAQVTGQVLALHVDENMHVTQATALLEIDPAPFRIAVDRATAQLQQARYQVQRTTAALHDAEALVRQREAELQNAIAVNTRTQGLLARQLAAKEKAELSETQMKMAQAALDSARARLAAERANLGSTGDENESVRQAKAMLEQAQWDLGNCEVRAPLSGSVINLNVRAGDVVTKNQSLFELIDTSEFWIDANFKETQLEHIRPGMETEVRIDMYPNQLFRGMVDSISGGSGTAFSLLPTQNATGNWVKIAQRVPVRIRVLEADPNFPLRIGTSGSVKIRMTGTPN